MNDFLKPVRIDTMAAEYLFRLIEAETDADIYSAWIKLKRIREVLTADDSPGFPALMYALLHGKALTQEEKVSLFSNLEKGMSIYGQVLEAKHKVAIEKKEGVYETF